MCEGTGGTARGTGGGDPDTVRAWYGTVVGVVEGDEGYSEAEEGYSEVWRTRSVWRGCGRVNEDVAECSDGAGGYSHRRVQRRRSA